MSRDEALKLIIDVFNQREDTMLRSKLEDMESIQGLIKGDYGMVRVPLVIGGQLEITLVAVGSKG